MVKKISTLPFNGTAEQEAELKKVIDASKDDKSKVMMVMQQAQDIYGYLPYEVQAMIAEGMDVPMEKIYGVATFYAQFSLVPKVKYSISVCLGTACYVKGSLKVLNRVCQNLGIEPGETTPDMKFGIEACRCLGACGLAPVFTVNGKVYGRSDEKTVDEVLEKLKAE